MIDIVNAARWFRPDDIARTVGAFGLRVRPLHAVSPHRAQREHGADDAGAEDEPGQVIADVAALQVSEAAQPSCRRRTRAPLDPDGTGDDADDHRPDRGRGAGSRVEERGSGGLEVYGGDR